MVELTACSAHSRAPTAVTSTRRKGRDPDLTSTAPPLCLLKPLSPETLCWLKTDASLIMPAAGSAACPALPWPALACPGLPWPALACPGLPARRAPGSGDYFTIRVPHFASHVRSLEPGRARLAGPARRSRTLEPPWALVRPVCPVRSGGASCRDATPGGRRSPEEGRRFAGRMPGQCRAAHTGPLPVRGNGRRDLPGPAGRGLLGHSWPAGLAALPHRTSGRLRRFSPAQSPGPADPGGHVSRLSAAGRNLT